MPPINRIQDSEMIVGFGRERSNYTNFGNKTFGTAKHLGTGKASNDIVPSFVNGRGRAAPDSIATAEQKIATLQRQIDAHRALSSSLAFDTSQKASWSPKSAPGA